MRDVEVLQGIVVFGVTVEGADVHVDVYGGEENVCGSVRFTFRDGGERRRKVRLLRAWQRQSTLITFTRAGSTITLVNEDAFGRQLATGG